MTGTSAAVRPAGLLEEAVSYAFSAVGDVTPGLLSGPTPCRGWNLEMLLRHASESLAALLEGICTGCLDPAATEDTGRVNDPVRVFRERARQLLAQPVAAAGHRELIMITGWPLPASVLEGAGALEITVHGWDVSQACGQRRLIPRRLAGDLLAIAPLLVPVTGRHPLFAEPVTTPPRRSPSDRLVAFLGRAQAC
jgi:uncharacterized protein (TIGR03086 family)